MSRSSGQRGRDRDLPVLPRRVAGDVEEVDDGADAGRGDGAVVGVARGGDAEDGLDARRVEPDAEHAGRHVLDLDLEVAAAFRELADVDLDARGADGRPEEPAERVGEGDDPRERVLDVLGHEELRGPRVERAEERLGAGDRHGVGREPRRAEEVEPDLGRDPLAEPDGEAPVRLRVEVELDGLRRDGLDLDAVGQPELRERRGEAHDAALGVDA